jgi:hypothetical protein
MLTLLTVAACIGLMAFTTQAAMSDAARGATRTTHAERASDYAGPAREIAMRPGVRTSSAQFTSRNWDGYITYVSSHGADFNAVNASWVQPAVTCPQPDAWTVFWVGLDGWWNDTVEQGGSSAKCIKGVPKYKVWWEMFPTNAITTVFAISSGDSITADVTYRSATATFVISVKDLTTGQSFTKNERCASNITCDHSSADFIAEDVGHFGGSSFFPLADYGTMAFTGARVTDTAGGSGGIKRSNWLNAAVTEKAGGITYATVSGLIKGTGFRATWQHA